MVTSPLYRSRAGLSAVLTGLAAIALGGLVALSLEVAALLLGLASLGLFVLAFVRYPKRVFIGFGIFLLLQDALEGIATLGGAEVSLATQRLDEIGIATMFAVILIRGHIRPSPIAVPLLALSGIALLSTLGAPVSPGPALLDLFLMIKGFLMFVIAYNLTWTSDDYRTMFRVFGITGVALILFGFIDPLTPPWQGAINLDKNIQYRAGIRAAQGIFSHPSAYGLVAMFFLLFALPYFGLKRNSGTLAVAGLFGFGALLSLRVAPAVSAVLAVMVAVLILRRLKAAWLAVVFSAFILIIGIAFSGPVQEVLSTKIASEQTGGARELLWKTGVQIAKDEFPLGTGLGTFGGTVSQDYYSPIYFRYGLNRVYGLSPGITSAGQSFVTDTHWPYVIGETGILGLFAYLAILFVIVRTLKRTLLQSQGFAYAFCMGALLSLLAACVAAFVSSGFQSSLGTYFTLGAAGAACSGLLSAGPAKEQAEAVKHEAGVLVR